MPAKSLKGTKKGSQPATDRQIDAIAKMSWKAGYRFSDQAVKDIIGKRPIQGLNKERASMVIEALSSMIEKQGEEQD